MSLTDATVRAFKAPAKGQTLYRDDTIAGFGCRVSQGGAKTFVLVHGPDRQFITIGRYPILSLSDARGEAKRLLAEFTLGRVRPQTITYPRAVALFLEDKAQAKRASTVAGYKRLLNNFGFKCALAEISHAEAARRLNRITAPSERSHALVAGKVFFNWCIKRRYLTENPLLGLAKPKHVPRSRVLSDHELKAIWGATAEPETFNKLIRFCMLTAQRRGEVAKLTPADVTADTCTIPSEIAKNAREHAIPLLPLARALVHGRDNYHYIFSETAKPFANWGQAKADLDRRSGVTAWTIHDIRRTVATNMAEAAVAPHVIERILNHITGSMSAIALIYNKAHYQNEMRAALGDWEQKLQKLCFR
jgi:integrase